MRASEAPPSGGGFSHHHAIGAGPVEQRGGHVGREPRINRLEDGLRHQSAFVRSGRQVHAIEFHHGAVHEIASFERQLHRLVQPLAVIGTRARRKGLG